MSRLPGLSKNISAFLDMIAASEGTTKITSDDGYNVIVGSTPNHPHLFSDYSDHPRVLVHLNAHLESTAAGRYQIIERFFDFYQQELNLPDFSPESQDEIAVRDIRECKATLAIEGGDLELAIRLCASRWASLPGNSYGQRQTALADLENAFKAAGGTING